jgi:hypothetical protein
MRSLSGGRPYCALIYLTKNERSYSRVHQKADRGPTQIDAARYGTVFSVFYKRAHCTSLFQLATVGVRRP